MFKKIDANTTTVADLVINNPELRQLFDSLRIDYCCNGEQNLAEAAMKANVELQTVLTSIEQTITQKNHTEQCPNYLWTEASLTELSNHIENTHHVFTKNTLSRLEKLLKKVIQAHGENHGDMLGQLQNTFLALKTELEMHLMKEEQVLFPYVRQMDASMRETNHVPPMHCGTVQHPIRQMKIEHKDAGESLAQLHTLTNGYTAPKDACLTFKALFEGLQELEDDLHEHIHLENNILFPQAIAMEQQGTL